MLGHRDGCLHTPSSPRRSSQRSGSLFPYKTLFPIYKVSPYEPTARRTHSLQHATGAHGTAPRSVRWRKMKPTQHPNSSGEDGGAPDLSGHTPGRPGPQPQHPGGRAAAPHGDVCFCRPADPDPEPDPVSFWVCTVTPAHRSSGPALPPVLIASDGPERPLPSGQGPPVTWHAGAVQAGGLLPAGVMHVFSVFQDPENSTRSPRQTPLHGDRTGHW